MVGKELKKSAPFLTSKRPKPPYHPQSDGTIERFNRTLLDKLSTTVENDHRNWDVQLPLLMLAYRTSVQETTGASPLQLIVSIPAATGTSCALSLSCLAALPNCLLIWSSISPLQLIVSVPAATGTSCVSTFSKLIEQFVSTHSWNKVGTSISMTAELMAPLIVLEMKCGCTVQLYRGDSVESFTGPGKDHS